MKKLTLLLVVLVVAILVAACGSDSDNAFEDPVQAQLDESRQLWVSDGFDSYKMGFQWRCFCHPTYTAPVMVSVGPGNVIGSVVYTDDGSPVDQTIFGGFETIDGLFALIQDAIDQVAVRISVQYHPETGYPMLVDIDYAANIADEERGFEVFSVSAN